MELIELNKFLSFEGIVKDDNVIMKDKKSCDL